MHRRYFPGLLFATLIVLTGIGCTSGESRPTEDEDKENAHHEEAELALHMARLQRWTQKTALALQAQNPEVADFYLHEMEESIETIQTEAPTYEGYEIADQTETFLVPSVESLDRALDDRDWSAVETRLTELAHACNQCHEATDHGFVKIDLEDVPNPYPQDFSAPAK